MENRSRGNVEILKKGDGLEQVHAQCLGHKVQVPAYSIVIQTTALAVKACFQVVGGYLKPGKSVGCCLWSVGCRPKSVGRCFNSAACCFKLGRSSVSALLQAPGAPAKMVRPQQRLLSRRGSAHGGSSRPPVTEPHLHCCRCHCHGRAKTNPLQASQFMDASSPNSDPDPLHAFGTANFTFGSSMDKPRINAHVSVLFLEETQDGEGGPRNMEKLPGGSSEDDEKRPVGAPEQAPNRPQAQKASTSKENIAEDWDSFPTAEEQEKYGWCSVVEEKPEE